MPAGRPLKFKSVEELQEKIDKFFMDCEAREEPYTITGLALALDTSRETLLEYEEREEFVDTIKRAKLRVHNFAEKRLYTGQPTGPIFALKNFGWSDKSQQEISGPNGQPIETKSEVTLKSDQDIIERYLQTKGAKQ